MERVSVFNIQHFSVHDGPGVRTVLFFKGCNLHCKWCHNPESIQPQKSMMHYSDRCIGCGACVEVCPVGAHSFENGVHRIQKEKCIHCFSCCNECYADALVCVGEEKETLSLMKEILNNREYFQQSGGGVTFSGGECMLQIQGLKELLINCKKEGIHTAVDTAGNVPWEYFEEILPWTDLFLYDVKAYDEEVHKKCTGVSNKRILENLARLVEKGANVTVRIPFVQELNGDEIEKIAGYLSSWKDIRAELLPYHSMGNSKYTALDEEGYFVGSVPKKELVADLKKKFHFY